MIQHRLLKLSNPTRIVVLVSTHGFLKTTKANFKTIQLKLRSGNCKQYQEVTRSHTKSLYIPKLNKIHNSFSTTKEIVLIFY